ncbi:MAG TPA: YhfC family glutamic-type intramembrane protease [Anaerolineae bacterium]|nr:YhfC family glutamic-type intramembrane protease [Anaerolineae bacterium]
MIIPLLMVNFFIMLAAAFGVGFWLATKHRASWELWAIGAGTFIASQFGHIPFNLLIDQLNLLPTNDLATNNINLLITAIFLGLSAGLFEETARYITFRWVRPQARSWTAGMMIGAGHGGVEALLISLAALIGIINAVIITLGDVAALLPADQIALVQDTLNSMAWYELILGGIERVFAVTCHLAFSLIVMQVFRRGQIRWLFVAIAGHTILNAAAVIGSQRLTPLETELIICFFAFLSFVLIISWRDQTDPTTTTDPESSPLTTPLTANDVNLPTNHDKIEHSRYHD